MSPVRPSDPSQFQTWANDVSARLRAIERKLLNPEDIELLQTLNSGEPLGDTLFLDFVGGARATLVGDRYVEVSGGGKRFATIVVAAADSELRGDGVDFICTGTADETTLDEAVAALPAAGGEILLLEGTYNLTGSWIIGSDGPCHVRGMGAGTVFTNSTGNYCVSNFGNASGNGDGNSVSWLKVLDSEFGIQCSSGLIFGCIVETSDAYVGAGSTAIDATGTNASVSHCIVKDRASVYNRGISAAGSDAYVGDCILDNIGDGSATEGALFLTGSPCVASNVLVLSPGTGNGVRSTGTRTRMVNIVVTDAAGSGFSVTGSDSSLIGCIARDPGIRGISCTGSGVSVIGCRVESPGASGGEGMLFTGSNCTVQGNVINNASFVGVNNDGSDSRFIGNVIDGAEERGFDSSGGRVIFLGNTVRSGRHGIYVENANDGIIQGNTVYDSGYDTTNTYDGIHLTNSDRWNVQGNTVRGADTQYGINVATSTCDDNLVTNNDLLNSGATGSFNDAGTGTITAAGNRL